MLEKDIENLIASHPDEFFPNSGFKLVGQQIKLGSCFADILFEDKHSRTIIVEIKRGILSRDASGQLIEYYGLLKQQYPDKIVELVLCANVIPNERRIFLENVGIECKELGLSLISNLAKKYYYRFLDENDQDKSKDTETIEKIVALVKNGNVWIFQANPLRYDILNALLDPALESLSWTVNRHQEGIKRGDIALIWMSGKEAGIYAVAKVTSNPSLMADSLAAEKYWMSEEDKGKTKIRVNMKIVKILINNPLLRDELKNFGELKGLSILRFSQGTNFPVTDDEWKVISAII